MFIYKSQISGERLHDHWSCVFIQFYVPFKIISLISRLDDRDKPIGRWGETGVTRENHLTHMQAEHGLSHMWPVRGSNLHQSQR